ncbi:hypothetical protein PAXRUDRAFT_135375 [Paxillus rubicundulus Ve08.2h10]|uniref:Uncharacterized protein n=1 Tax=Paxillus rubicundulus Ve08.2h10 TaxID=930991 RepID=A0A0D0E1X2_9AGAM|nr:hypothetical protein PAXRUDRAFT_135375 [Paxillus rubicundulus Ve08.2h10]
MATNYLKEKQISLFVGITLALFMYGISLCQQYYYYRAYPHDRIHQKCLAMNCIRGVNTLQLYCLVQQQWRCFVTGHGDLGAFKAFPWQDMFVVPYMVQWSTGSFGAADVSLLAGGGILCDMVITVSVYYYLRPSRTGARSGITFAVWITRYVQGPMSPFVAPIMVTSQSYVNSLMTVLNARKPSQCSGAQLSTIQVPTLPTIHEEEQGVGRSAVVSYV